MRTKIILRIFLTCVYFIGVLAMNAQTDPKKVYVYKTDGTATEYNIVDIDSISFTPPATTPVESLPFVERFNEATFPPQYWQMIDHDGDGYQWYAYSNRFIGAMSDSYSDDGDDLTPYNFLISPKIAISGANPKLEWNIGSAASSAVEEHYKVVVSTTEFTEDNCTSIGDVVFEETLGDGTGRTLVNRSVDMNAYAGKDVYIAWVHYDCVGVYALLLTDIRIGSTENPAPVTAPVMGTLPAAENTSPGLYTVESIISNDGGVSVVKRGFCYSTSHNPTTGNTVVEVAADASNVLSSFSADLDLVLGKTYYVRAFAQNAAGVTYSNEQTVEVPDVTNNTVLLDESFATDPFVRGWTDIDRDGDGYNWNYYDNPPSITSDSYIDDDLTPENYLISPSFTIPVSAQSVTLAFQVAAGASGTDYKEHYKVIASENEITFDNCRNADVLQDWTELTDANRAKTFTNVAVDMTAYKGKTVYIGIVHGDCTGQWFILVRNLKVYTVN